MLLKTKMSFTYRKNENKKKNKSKLKNSLTTVFGLDH